MYKKLDLVVDYKIKVKQVLTIMICFLAMVIEAQSVYYPASHQAVRYVENFDILDSVGLNIHTAIRNYSRKSVAQLMTSHEELKFIQADQYNYLIKDNQLYVDSSHVTQDRRGVFGIFYKEDPYFFRLDKGAFKFIANPILNINLGYEKDFGRPQFINTRGIEIYGEIDHKVYFYTHFNENQRNFNNYIEDRIRKHKAIPGNSFFVPFTSRVSDQISGHDFANAQGFIGVPITKHIGIELGHGRHFIGHGYHSLLLGDYANNYFYLKFNTKVWKLHYQNIFAELAPISTRLNPNDNLLPKKYMATHYLSFKPNKVFEIGLFETVIFSRLNNFEFHYLNPIILYRAVEFYLDSPDNVMVGINGKLNLFKRFALYGQFLLDDVKTTRLFDGSGWWGNKFGFQGGVKYPQAFGIKNLDIQAEANLVRPYTYGHRDTVPDFTNYSIANYSTFNQPLAHPLGANFYEFLFLANYDAIDNVFINLRMSYAKQGNSSAGKYVGDEILIPNEQRISDFGNTFLQGQRRTIKSLALDISYSFFHNYYLDLRLLYRKESGDRELDTSYFSFGLRANMNHQRLDY